MSCWKSRPEYLELSVCVDSDARYVFSQQDEDDYSSERQAAASRKKTKKKSSARKGEEGHFIQRNVSSQKKGKTSKNA